MKNLIQIILFAMLISALAAKAEEETLLGAGIENVGAYFSIDSHVSHFDSDINFLTGGRFVLIFNNVIGIGSASSEIADGKTFELNGVKADLTADYGGLYFEYINNYSSSVHYNLNCLLGFGTASFNDVLIPDGNGNSWFKETSSFFVVEPKANIEVNVISYVRLELGAGYRFAMGVELPYFDDADINGFTATLGIKIGLFQGYNLKKIFGGDDD